MGSSLGTHQRLTRSQQFRRLAQKDSVHDLQEGTTPQLAHRGEILQSAEQLAEIIDRDVLARFRETELRAAVTEAVHHLPERVRAVAVLYYLEMWTIKEIAKELGLAVAPSRQGSVKFGHSYARNLGLKKLREENYGA